MLPFVIYHIPKIAPLEVIYVTVLKFLTVHQEICDTKKSF